MKKNILSILFLLNLFNSFSQIAADQAEYLMGLPQATDLDEIELITNPQIGSIVYSIADEKIYRYTGFTNGWQAAGNQNADEVDTVASTLDLDGDGDVDVDDIIDTDGDGTPEETSQDVFEAITPITSKAGRVFYPPSIEIDASTITTGTTDESINLYNQYANQYDLTSGSTTINGVTVNYTTAKSPSAPNNIPIYQPDELYYYVTFADTSIFNITGLTDTGILSYRILAIPDNDNTIINVVFVVK